MNHASSVGHFDRGADLQEEREALAKRKVLFFHIVGDGSARHILHDKVGQTVRGRSGIEKCGNVGMVQ